MGASDTSSVFPRIVTTGDVIYQNPFWDDKTFPFIGRRLDSTSGRLAYNYAEKGVTFADNCRFLDEDSLHFTVQFNHTRKAGSNFHIHLHWFQNQDELPNWVMSYRAYDNGDLVPSSYTHVAATPGAFTYVSGTLAQICDFGGEIDGSGLTGLSAFVDIRLSRDISNASGLFAGVDQYSGSALGKELDVHYLLDTPGSRLEYSKFLT